MDYAQKIMDNAPQIIDAVLHPTNAIADYVLKNYLYDSQTKRPFPASPYWGFQDANKIQDPQARQRAMIDSALPMVMGMTGEVQGQNLVTQPARAAKSLPNTEGDFYVNVRNKLTGETTAHGPYQSNRVAISAGSKIPLNKDEIAMVQSQGKTVLDNLLERKVQLEKGGYSTAAVDKAIQQEMQVGKNAIKANKAINSDLMSEAKKYKSAEEFVNSQQKMLRGSKYEGVSNSPMGTFLTNDNNYAKTFAGKKGKVNELFVDKNRLKIAKSVGGIDEMVAKEPWQSTDALLENQFNPDMGAIKKLQDRGYNAFESSDGRQLLVFDNSLLKTKSQLTDIYNQAKGGKK